VSLRLFVALELPAAAVSALAEVRAAADPAVWRPVADAALHLTLAFLGPRPEEAVARCAAVLAAAAGPAPALALGGAILLPPRRARVLAVEVADVAGELAPLQRRVSEGLAGEGLFVPEARAFRPHVTVARLRAGARAPREAPRAPEVPGTPREAPEPVAFAATSLTLVASRLHPSGARYEALARAAWADAAAL